MDIFDSLPISVINSKFLVYLKNNLESINILAYMKYVFSICVVFLLLLVSHKCCFLPCEFRRVTASFIAVSF